MKTKIIKYGLIILLTILATSLVISYFQPSLLGYDTTEVIQRRDSINIELEDLQDSILTILKQDSLLQIKIDKLENQDIVTIFDSITGIGTPTIIVNDSMALVSIERLRYTIRIQASRESERRLRGVSEAKILLLEQREDTFKEELEMVKVEMEAVEKYYKKERRKWILITTGSIALTVLVILVAI